MKTTKASRYHTQWAAQFYIAAELTRRGYLIALTLGNAPRTDIIATRPPGISFRVECKGTRTKGTWLFKCDKPEKNLFFVFVYIPKKDIPPQYFILDSKEAFRILVKYRESHPNQKPGWSSCNWGDIASFEDKWDKLPE
ncbi:MAG: hypothetical protein P9X24_05520 [Candidatus Hatepunaea meridiana]|nr:hypothetical protein [Candidatus Hatepunaea meridiana]